MNKKNPIEGEFKGDHLEAAEEASSWSEKINGPMNELAAGLGSIGVIGAVTQHPEMALGGAVAGAAVWGVKKITQHNNAVEAQDHMEQEKKRSL
jgi:hypothetical protein